MEVGLEQEATRDIPKEDDDGNKKGNGRREIGNCIGNREKWVSLGRERCRGREGTRCERNEA